MWGWCVHTNPATPFPTKGGGFSRPQFLCPCNGVALGRGYGYSFHGDSFLNKGCQKGQRKGLRGERDLRGAQKERGSVKGVEGGGGVLALGSGSQCETPKWRHHLRLSGCISFPPGSLFPCRAPVLIPPLPWSVHPIPNPALSPPPTPDSFRNWGERDNTRG